MLVPSPHFASTAWARLVIVANSDALKRSDHCAALASAARACDALGAMRPPATRLYSGYLRRAGSAKARAGKAAREGPSGPGVAQMVTGWNHAPPCDFLP